MASTRRSVLAALIASPVLAMADNDLSAAAPTFGLDLTPACRDGDEQTVVQTEGPYFKPNAPLKSDLAVDAPGGEMPTSAKGTGPNLACRRVRGL